MMKKKILKKIYGGGAKALESAHYREHFTKKLCRLFGHLGDVIQGSISFLDDHLEEGNNLIKWTEEAETHEEFLQRYKNAHRQLCRLLSSCCKIRTYIVDLLLKDELCSEQEHSEYTKEGTCAAHQPAFTSRKDMPLGRQGESPWEAEGIISKDEVKLAAGTSGSRKIGIDGKASESIKETYVLDKGDGQPGIMKPGTCSSHHLSSSSFCSELGQSTSISLDSRKSDSSRSRNSCTGLRAVDSNSEDVKGFEVNKEGTQEKTSDMSSQGEMCEKKASNQLVMQEISSLSSSVKESDRKMEESQRKEILGWTEFCDRRDKSCREKNGRKKVSAVKDEGNVQGNLGEKFSKEKTEDLRAVSKSSDETLRNLTKKLENMDIPDNYSSCENRSSKEKSKADGGECGDNGQSLIVKDKVQKSVLGDDHLELKQLTETGSSSARDKNSARKNIQLNSIPSEEVPFGQSVDVVISHIEDPRTVWLQRWDSRLEDFQSKLNFALVDSKPLLKHPVVGDIVASVFSNDKAFYRAKVMDIEERDVFTVQFLDYGNEDCVFSEDLRELPEVFWEFPCFGLRCLLHGIDEIPDEASAALVQELEKWADDSPMKAVFHEVAEGTGVEVKCLKVSLELQSGTNLLEVYPSASFKSCEKDGENTSYTRVVADDESEGHGSFRDFDSGSMSRLPQIPKNLTVEASKSLNSEIERKWEPLSEEQMSQVQPKWFRSLASVQPKVYVTDGSGAVWVRIDEQTHMDGEDKGANTESISSSVQETVTATEEEFPSLSGAAASVDEKEYPSLSDTTSIKKKKKKRKKKKKSVQTHVDAVGIREENEERGDCGDKTLSESSEMKGAAADTGTVYEKLPHVFLESMPIPGMGEEVMAHIVYINNPSDFFVHLVDSEANQIASFQDNLQDFYEDLNLEEELTITKVPCGTYWAVKDQDDHWYRCKVIKNKEEPDLLEVLLVDHGPVITTSAKDLHVLREEFTHSPAFAIPCSLDAVYPLEGNYWPQKTIGLFQQLCGDDETFIINFVKKKPTGTYSVILKKFNEEPLNEILKVKEVASHKPEVEVRVQQETGQDCSKEDLNQEWDPMASEFLSKENNPSNNRECAETAFTNYSSTDEKRLCKFYRVGTRCPKGDACKWEHTIMREGGKD